MLNLVFHGVHKNQVKAILAQLSIFLPDVMKEAMYEETRGCPKHVVTGNPAPYLEARCENSVLAQKIKRHLVPCNIDIQVVITDFQPSAAIVH